MYNQNQNASVVPQPQPQEGRPELQGILDRLASHNISYASLLYEIEAKLHSILNLRNPTKQVTGVQEPKVGENDFVHQMHEYLTNMDSYNARLQDVHSHLQRIC